MGSGYPDGEVGGNERIKKTIELESRCRKLQVDNKSLQKGVIELEFSAMTSSNTQKTLDEEYGSKPYEGCSIDSLKGDIAKTESVIETLQRQLEMQQE